MTNQITPDILAAIRAACEGVPPNLCYDEHYGTVSTMPDGGGYVIARTISGLLGQSQAEAHAVERMIEIARRHLLPLCDEVERLRAELARVTAERDALLTSLSEAANRGDGRYTP